MTLVHGLVSVFGEWLGSASRHSPINEILVQWGQAAFVSDYHRYVHTVGVFGAPCELGGSQEWHGFPSIGAVEPPCGPKEGEYVFCLFLDTLSIFACTVARA